MSLRWSAAQNVPPWPQRGHLSGARSISVAFMAGLLACCCIASLLPAVDGPAIGIRALATPAICSSSTSGAMMKELASLGRREVAERIDNATEA
jgi:hypothetical protein